MQERKTSLVGFILRWNCLVGNVIKKWNNMKEKGRRQMAIVTDDIKEGALCKGMKRDLLVWKYMFRSYVLELSHERRLWMNELPVQTMQFY